MSNQTENYELLFEGTESANARERFRLSSLLENACGFQLIELETALSNAGHPISIMHASAQQKLDSIRKQLEGAGAKVLIVNSCDFNGIKFLQTKKI